MNTELINKISTLTLYAFYDTSKDMLTVHFINEKSGKPDLMAYLLLNNTWDVREVVEERSKVFPDREVIEIIQKPVGIFEPNSGFDQMIKKAIAEIAKTEEPKVSIMQELLDKVGYE